MTQPYALDVHRADLWTDGFGAWRAGEPSIADPYQPGSEEYMAWLAGWVDARRAYDALPDAPA